MAVWVHRITDIHFRMFVEFGGGCLKENWSYITHAHHVASSQNLQPLVWKRTSVTTIKGMTHSTHKRIHFKMGHINRKQCRSNDIQYKNSIIYIETKLICTRMLAIQMKMVMLVIKVYEDGSNSCCPDIEWVLFPITINTYTMYFCYMRICTAGQNWQRWFSKRSAVSHAWQCSANSKECRKREWCKKKETLYNNAGWNTYQITAIHRNDIRVKY